MSIISINMPISTQPYKGARDFYPEDKRLQKYVFNMWRKVCENFGYEEYDAPIVEPLEIYLAKTSEEIVSEQTYVFEDRGGRKVTLRPEMTPSVSRLVAARRQELSYPLRLYSIPELWRYERPQRGRLRQHWQLNADIFGVAGIEADQEIIEMADAIMQAFGADRKDYKIRLNNRALMNAITTDYLGLNSNQSQEVIRLIDKMHKLDAAKFRELLSLSLEPQQNESGVGKKLEDLMKVTSLNGLPAEIVGSSEATKLAAIIELLEKQGITNASYDPTLMRGFDYYTDIVFEVFDADPENNRSMFGGGRYDGLIGEFGVEPLPTVGFGMGDVTLQNFLESHSLLPELNTETELYAILIGEVYARSQPIIQSLRQMGVNVATDFSQRKPEKQLKTALKRGIPYAVFIGEKELSANKYSFKDLAASKESTLSLEEISKVIVSSR